MTITKEGERVEQERVLRLRCLELAIQRVEVRPELDILGLATKYADFVMSTTR